MEKKKKAIPRYSIADFIDLSLVDVLTLQFLVRHSEPVVRHTLYREVLRFLENIKSPLEDIDSTKLTKSERRYYNFLKDKKLLSTSSFYNNLNNLEKRGLILSNYNKKGKIETIEITNLTNPLLKEILKHFVSFGVRTEEPAMLMIKDEILKRIGKKEFENTLVVWLNFYLDFQILRMVYNLTDNLFILSYDDYSKELLEKGLENVNFSSIYNDLIREPNNIFDITFFPFYSKNSSLNGLTLTDLLKEAVRVTQKDGVILITAQSTIPNVHGVLISNLIKLYRKANQQTIYSIEELEQDLIDAGVEKTDVFEYQGELIGIGWV